MPTISQWPVVVSLPGEASVQRPKAPAGCGAGDSPASGLMLPRPSAAQVRQRGGRACARCCRACRCRRRRNRAASGISPMPTLSSTIQMTRRNTRFERNMRLARGRRYIGATALFALGGTSRYRSFTVAALFGDWKAASPICPGEQAGRHESLHSGLTQVVQLTPTVGATLRNGRSNRQSCQSETRPESEQV